MVDYVLNVIPQNNLRKINILIFGIDETPGVQRSDSIFLAHMDLDNKYIKIYSIPRDTYVDIAGVGRTKINHAYAYGKEPLLQETLETLFNIRINYYVKVNLANVETIFDKIGGIKIDVEKNMRYVDRSQNLFIDLRKGEQVLKGKDLIGFLRFRHDAMGDISRIGRQQEFIKAVVIEGLGNMGIMKSLYILKEVYPYLDTNLSLKDQLTLAVQVNNIYKNGVISIKTLSGTPQMINRVSYWIADSEEVTGIGQEFGTDTTGTNDYFDEDGMVISRDSKINDNYKENAAEKSVDSSFKINIINGSGRNRYSLKAFLKLKRNGFGINSVENANTSDYDKTMIIDWGVNNQSDFLKLTKLISIDPKKIVRYHNQQKRNEVTLIIGRDWKNIN